MLCRALAHAGVLQIWTCNLWRRRPRRLHPPSAISSTREQRTGTSRGPVQPLLSSDEGARPSHSLCLRLSCVTVMCLARCPSASVRSRLLLLSGGSLERRLCVGGGGEGGGHPLGGGRASLARLGRCEAAPWARTRAITAQSCPSPLLIPAVVTLSGAAMCTVSSTGGCRSTVRMAGGTAAAIAAVSDVPAARHCRQQCHPRHVSE